MAEKTAVRMTVRRWRSAIKARLDYETTHLTAWDALREESRIAYKAEEDIAVIEMNALLAELEIAWKNKAFHMFLARPRMFGFCIWVGTWAADFIHARLESGNYPHLETFEALGDQLVELDVSTLPILISPPSSEVQQVLIEFQDGFEQVVADLNLKANDKVDIQLVLVTILGLSFKPSDIVILDDESSLEE